MGETIEVNFDTGEVKDRSQTEEPELGRQEMYRICRSVREYVTQEILVPHEKLEDTLLKWGGEKNEERITQYLELFKQTKPTLEEAFCAFEGEGFQHTNFALALSAFIREKLEISESGISFERFDKEGMTLEEAIKIIEEGKEVWLKRPDYFLALADFAKSRLDENRTIWG